MTRVASFGFPEEIAIPSRSTQQAIPPWVALLADRTESFELGIDSRDGSSSQFIPIVTTAWTFLGVTMMPDRANPNTDPGSSSRAIVIGASSGIGRATALALAAEGWDVLVHGFRKVHELNELAESIRGMGRRCEAIRADLGDPEAVLRLAEEAWAKWGGLDAWLHLAGADILTGEGRHLRFEDKLSRLWAVDVLSSVTACRSIGRRMEEQGHGSIITMGWDQAETGMDGDSGELFATTKAAVMAFTKSLAMSLAPKVRVNGVAPGWIRTAWGDTAPKAWQDRVLRETPLDRWGTPEDVAETCVFLASRRSSFLTGQIVRVNGGAIR